jgi:ribonuclease HIII
VTQRTRVIVVPPEEREALQRSLGAGRFEHRAVPHAVFSVKGDGVVATLYRSGKLVIQGDDPDVFAARYLGREPAEAPAQRASRAAPGTPPEMPLVGSDEAGKGDYFGPLVVAAVRVEPSEADELAASRVMDSKRLADETALRMGAALRGRYAHAIARLDPPRYNEVYAARPGKLNDLLADLHAQAIGELARKGDHVIVDQFANESLLERRLAPLGIELEQRPRAEEIPVVAAASVIAREAFLNGLRELSEACGVDLHKGAGAPVDRVAARVLALHGEAGLGRFAKLHFKNTQKIRRRRP